MESAESVESLLTTLFYHGINKSCHLQQIIGLIPSSNISRLKYLFHVFDQSVPELLNTHGFRLYGATFLKCLVIHIQELHATRSDIMERQRIKDQSEKAILDHFFLNFSN